MKRTGFVFLLLLIFFSVLSAQERFKISKPELTLSDNIFTVKYDITGCGKGELIDIALVLLNSKGDTIKPRSISGDIGSRINCGISKTIIWDLSKDNVEIDEDIQIFLQGNPSVQVVSNVVAPELNNITRGNILLLSAIIPGLGQKKASGKSTYLVFSGLVYGSLGTSCYYNFFKSKQLKKDYLAASDIDQRDDLFLKWGKSYNMTKYFFYGAVGVWGINIIWSTLIPIRENPVKRMDIGLTSFRKNELLVSAKWKF